MANVTFLDVVKFVATSGGTGSFVVSSAATGYQTPATAGAISSQQFHYRAESTDLTQWEIGLGTYTSSNTTLTRSPLINVSGGTSAYNFSAAPQVGFVILAEDWNAIGQIVGTNTNDNASAGNIGEYISITTLASQAVTFQQSTALTVTDLTLQSGDWDVWAGLTITPVGGAAQTLVEGGVTTSSNSRAVSPNGGCYVFDQQAKTAGGSFAYALGQMRQTSSIAFTVFLNGFVQWSGGTSLTGNGFIGARRAR